jgi:hypothetical protein
MLATNSEYLYITSMVALASSSGEAPPGLVGKQLSPRPSNRGVSLEL